MLRDEQPSINEVAAFAPTDEEPGSRDPWPGERHDTAKNQMPAGMDCAQ